MDAEVGEIAGAGKGEISPEARETWRNGYRRRYWDTRVGRPSAQGKCHHSWEHYSGMGSVS